VAKRVQSRIMTDDAVTETTRVMVENEEGIAEEVRTAVHGVVLGSVLSQQQQPIHATESDISDITPGSPDDDYDVEGAGEMNETTGVAVENEEGRAEEEEVEVVLGNVPSQQQESIQSTESDDTNVTQRSSDDVEGVSGTNERRRSSVEDETDAVWLGHRLYHYRQQLPRSTSIPVITQPSRNHDDDDDDLSCRSCEQSRFCCVVRWPLMIICCPLWMPFLLIYLCYKGCKALCETKVCLFLSALLCLLFIILVIAAIIFVIIGNTVGVDI